MTDREARLFWTAVLVLAVPAILLGFMTAEWGFIPTT